MAAAGERLMGLGALRSHPFIFISLFSFSLSCVLSLFLSFSGITTAAITSEATRKSLRPFSTFPASWTLFCRYPTAETVRHATAADARTHRHGTGSIGKKGENSGFGELDEKWIIPFQFRFVTVSDKFSSRLGAGFCPVRLFVC